MATPSASAVELPPELQGELDVLMIDNFDSFTWNLYQHLCLLGAEVTVVRNDAISPEHFPLLKIKRLIVSPGPGHPKTDSGVSRQAIEYFTGKVPVLGVCMGLECMVDLHGGEIGYAGEIMHGKVSRVRHDGRGCFKGLPQGILSTRYHSLSTQITSLPPQLAITSTTEESGVIMGVRHREFTVEGVQYHPESIISASGEDLLRNFLNLRGGTWAENPASGVLDPNLPPFPVEALPNHIRADESSVKKVGSILEKIYAQRQQDIDKAQNTPGTTLEDLHKIHALNLSPPLIPFLTRLKSGITPNSPALLAEIKRASPSKGHIAVKTNPAEQALKYALAGASTISVLTEPHWFLGSLQDMLNARNAVANLPNRPAILRKDFIVNRYQVLESRIWGADTILLIVAMLPEPTLRDLYVYSLDLGMEPLVEVNSEREMELAISLGAKVIGINNRNLHNFNVDMETTSRVGAVAKDHGDVVICALSGISGRQDVEKYKSQGVGGILVGESLMRAADTGAFVRELLGLDEEPREVLEWTQHPPLVKICGIRTPEEAVGCAEVGVDFLGLNFVPTSKRAIDVNTAKSITSAIKSLPLTTSEVTTVSLNTPWFTNHANRISRVPRTRPLIVALFQNAHLSTILSVLSAVDGIDIVQLHGDEPLEFSKHIPRPVIKAFNTQTFTSQGGLHHFALIDSLSGGGTGTVADWDKVKEIVEKGEVDIGSLRDAEGKNKWAMPIMLAGGLNPSNVAEAIKLVRPWAVDVAGGVELEGGKGKDLEKVKAFVEAAKSL